MRNPIIALALTTLVAATAHAARFPNNSPASTNNDDSCDLSLLPAATLLLPYFEVDFISPQTIARTTLFTVYNTTQRPQIAHVTIWTDLAFPVVDFNIFLTGYDVQSINLYDFFARGVIAPPSGTTNKTPPGDRSLANGANPNFLSSAAAACATLPGPIPPSLMADIKSAVTTGTYGACGTNRVGTTHALAVGYVTIDVIATCSTTLPTDPGYYSSELLFDNVLGGDAMIVNPNTATGNYAGGNPLVHIRALPEGGQAGTTQLTNLPYTFYDRYTPRTGDRTRDRRQPLPSTFAARFIQGGQSAFNTNYRIWREGVTGENTSCSSVGSNSGTGMGLTDEVRFDEHENSTTLATIIGLPLPGPGPTLPAVSSIASSSPVFPPVSSATADVGGWTYLNLNNGGSPQYSVTTNGFSVSPDLLVRPDNPRNFRNAGTTRGERQSQNWVGISMFAEGRFSTDFDALMLANGCSPALVATGFGVEQVIGPGPNPNP